jgi:hypothetical protein
VSKRVFHLDNVVVVPEDADDSNNLFHAVYHDIGLPEFMAYSALEAARSAWEEDLNYEDDFVQSTLMEAIETLKRFHAAWRATVVAQQRIDASARSIVEGDFTSARKLLSEAEAMRKGFNPKEIEHTLRVLKAEPNKVRELVERGEEA